jgi:hypothetical protein
MLPKASVVRRWRRGLWAAAAVSLLGVVPACARPNLRGDGFENRSRGWPQAVRPPADPSKFWGLDARAREIERDLGVR